MAGKDGTVFFTTIGRHLKCAIQSELVVELELALTGKEAISSISAQLYHMAERLEIRVGWHGAKVKGHAELKVK